MNHKVTFCPSRLLNFPSLVNATLLIFATSLHAQQWQQVAEIPAGQTTALFALGDTLFAAGLNKIYYTHDGGDTWDSTATISPTLDYIVSMRHINGRLYAGTVVEGVFSSSNGGQIWQADNNGLVGLGARNISSLAVRGDSLYAGTYGAKVFVKKISSNSNWSAYNMGIPWGNIESLTNIGGKLYAGAGGNATVTMQTLPGHTWTEVPFAMFDGSFNAFLGVVKQGDVLLAAGTLGVYRSTDDGANWSPYNPGTGVLGSAQFVEHGDRVIANLAKPAALSFLQYTDNQGQSWQNFEPAAPNSFGYDIALFNGKLYSARDNGLWRIALTTNVEEPVSELSELGQNFPNPFTDYTTIPFTLPQSSQVELLVFDLSGKHVRVLWRGEKPAGLHQVEFQAGDLPAGMYVCRLATETGVATKLMTLSK